MAEELNLRLPQNRSQLVTTPASGQNGSTPRLQVGTQFEHCMVRLRIQDITSQQVIILYETTQLCHYKQLSGCNSMLTINPQLIGL